MYNLPSLFYVWEYNRERWDKGFGLGKYDDNC